MTGSGPVFQRIALLGIGLIGSSLARAFQKHGLGGDLDMYTRSPSSRETEKEL